ncbi:MAG: response regulator [Pseudomonadota bacterium]
MPNPSDYLILVVDDEEDILAYLRAALEDVGFRVATAASGQEALDRARSERPDFVSLDLVMPGGSGIAFLHELRRSREWISIPVMVVTGHARDELGKAELENALDGKLLCGPHAYLEKPVAPNAYVAAVCNALGLPVPAPSPSKIDPSETAPSRIAPAKTALSKTAPPKTGETEKAADLRAEVDRLLASASSDDLARIVALLNDPGAPTPRK